MRLRPASGPFLRGASPWRSGGRNRPDALKEAPRHATTDSDMKLGWRSIVGLIVSTSLLGWVFSNVPWGIAVEHLRRADVKLLVLAAVAATSIFPLRARRWRTILDPVELHIPFRPLWHATAIGMMINNVLPARAGELARAYALTRERKRIQISTAVASLAVDRLFDLIVMLGLLFLAMLSPAMPTGGFGPAGMASRAAAAGLLMLVGGVVGLYVFALYPAPIVAGLAFLARQVAPSLERHVHSLLHSFAGGLAVLRSPTRFMAVLWWTTLHWLANAVAFWLAFKAVHLDAPFAAALFLQAIIGLGIAVPSVPGFFGPFEFFAKLGLGVFGVAPALATTWAVTFHVLSFVPITLIGAAYFVRAGLTLDELARATPQAAPAAIALEA